MPLISTSSRLWHQNMCKYHHQERLRCRHTRQRYQCLAPSRDTDRRAIFAPQKAVKGGPSLLEDSSEVPELQVGNA
jgi:hypothetical protein